MRLTALLSMAAKAAFPRNYRYGTSRPWTFAAKRRNPPGLHRKKVFVDTIPNEQWSVFRGDTVGLCFAASHSPTQQHCSFYWKAYLTGVIFYPGWNFSRKGQRKAGQSDPSVQTSQLGHFGWTQCGMETSQITRIKNINSLFLNVFCVSTVHHTPSSI